MSEIKIHLLLNHIPIVSIFIGFIILIIGTIRKTQILLFTGFIIIIFAAIVAIPTINSGEGAEHHVEELDKFSHDVIHEHEEAAESAIWVVYLSGLLSIAALYLTSKEHKLARLFTILTIIVSLVSLVMLANVGNTGGKIRRPDLVQS